MTDRDSRLLWFGDYDGWGRLDSETNITGAHQPFRLQNQYFDAETGLHYNFYRYYDPNSGRFINQDPIGLLGGANLYQFADNVTNWTDPSGLTCLTPKQQLSRAVKQIKKLRAEELKKPRKQRSTVVNVIVTTDGNVIKGTQPISLEDVDSSVKNLYDSVPESNRGNGHGRCAEVCSLDKGKAGHKHLEGAVSVAMRVDKGVFIRACGSCHEVLKRLKIIDGVRKSGALKKL